MARVRYGHCAVAIDGTVLMWGGDDENSDNIAATITDTFGSTTGQWGTVSSTGAAPLAVWGSAGIAVHCIAYSFGGLNDQSRCSNDLHQLSPTMKEWVKVEIANIAEGPKPKGFCGLLQRGQEELVVMGGELDDETDTDEIHVVNLREAYKCRDYLRRTRETVLNGTELEGPSSDTNVARAVYQSVVGL